MKKVFFALTLFATIISACKNDYGPERLEAAKEMIVAKDSIPQIIEALKLAKHYKSVERQADSLLQAIYLKIHVEDSVKVVKDSLENENRNKMKQELLQYFTVKKDEIDEGEWITPKATGSESVNNNNIFTYIYKSKNGASHLHLRIDYASDDWLFIDNVDFKVDSNDVINLSKFDYGNYQTDNHTTIWEWKDYNVDEKLFGLLYEIAKCKTCKIRLNGSKYYHDTALNSYQIKDFERTIKLHLLMNGK